MSQNNNKKMGQWKTISLLNNIKNQQNNQLVFFNNSKCGLVDFHACLIRHAWTIKCRTSLWSIKCASETLALTKNVKCALDSFPEGLAGDLKIIDLIRSAMWCSFFEWATCSAKQLFQGIPWFRCPHAMSGENDWEVLSSSTYIFVNWQGRCPWPCILEAKGKHWNPIVGIVNAN